MFGTFFYRNHLNFCLLGVASPSELIADKKRTPFNIGQAIFLKGFQWEEVEPLKRGLQGKVGDLNTVMKEILEWTGGQPFLTQKLCQFVFEESDRDQPRSVEEIVRARIIANWESQDEPEHLKTIRDRLLYRNEQRAGYLLELYQQIRQQVEIPLNDSLEQSELQLSGLVVKRQGKLLVTNLIYREVFNQIWIDEQLASLRPYSENFRAWIASGGEDESRLLRGQALVLAEEWTKNKSLSYQDREFLAASKNLAIEEENKKAQLERERKDKEAELEREREAREVAEAANRKAQRRIRIGSIILGVTLLGTTISAGWGSLKFQEALKFQDEAKEAIQQKQDAEDQFQEVTTQLNKAKEDAKKADQRVKQVQAQETKAKRKAVEAEKQERLAKEKADQAQKDLENAQQALEQAKTERASLKQEVQTLEKTTQDAERKAKETQKLIQKAKQELTYAQKEKSDAEKEAREAKTALEKLQEKYKNIYTLAKLSEQLEQESIEKAEEIRRRTFLSYAIEDIELRKAFLLSSISLAYQNLGRYKEAEEAITNSLNLLGENIKSDIYNDQFVVFLDALNTESRLFKIQKDLYKALSSYEKAFEFLQAKNSEKIVINNPSLKALTRENIVLVYRGLMESLLLQSNKTEFNKQNIKRVIQLFEAFNLSQLSDFSQKDDILQIPLLDESLVPIHEIDSTAAVIYTIILEDSLAVILKLTGKEYLTYYITKISQEDLAKNIKELRYRLTEVTYFPSQVQEYSQKLYEWIIRPAEEKLQENNIENLVFVLDGMLRNIPMAVLYDQNEQKYLIEKYPIALAPGLQLLDPKPIEPRQINVLAAGLSEGRELEQRMFSPLRYVKKELENIKLEVPASYELLNENFDYQKLQAQLATNKYNIVHLATHGQFSSHPDQTFIVLSDKLLKISDLDNLLRVEKGNQSIPIELLVLSACQTAFGDNWATLGLAGFAVRAGVRSTLGTLWSVGDDSTAELMSEFYHQLINTDGISKAEALQKAQIKILHDENHDKPWDRSYYWDRPYYWANYVLIGNWF